MLMVLQMRVQGTNDQQIVSLCWDRQFSNYWYFSRGVAHPSHGVLAVATKVDDGFTAAYPPNHATGYHMRADGVHILSDGQDTATHPIVPDANGASGLICVDRTMLPLAMSEQLVGDGSPCAPENVLAWIY